MRVLMLWRYYPIYLSYFYQKYPEVLDLLFEEHRQRLFDDHFGWPADLSQHMNQQGIDTEFIIANAESLQKKWAKEQGFKNFNERNWEKAIALEQIRRFRPDVLWIPNPTEKASLYLDGAEGYYKKLMFWLGHDEIPKGDILQRADYLITPHPERILKHHPQVRNLVSVHAGFSPKILNQLGAVKKKYDIVFLGSITPEHQRRVEILSYLIKNGIDLKIFGTILGSGRKYMLKGGGKDLRKRRYKQGVKSLAKSFWGSTYMKNVATIKTVLKPAVFGMGYYRTIAQARVGLNTHGDVEENHGNMRMFETTGVGTCLITEDVEANAEIFGSGKEIMTFNSKEHLLDLLQKVDFQSKQIQDIAYAGQQRTLRDHSIDRMFNDIRKILDENVSSGYS